MFKEFLKTITVAIGVIAFFNAPFIFLPEYGFSEIAINRIALAWIGFFGLVCPSVSLLFIAFINKN